MELAELIILALAVVVAIVSAFYAYGANRRADAANEHAARALDLQSRIDAREREYVDVDWLPNWADDVAEDEAPAFLLKNEGLTTACAVTLVLHLPHGRQAFTLGDITPGQMVRVPVVSDSRGPVFAAAIALLGRRYDVHWSTPAGAAHHDVHPGLQVF